MNLMRCARVVIVAVLILTPCAGAATFTSAASGSWDTAATWTNNAVPGAADDVIIQNSNNVTISGSKSANSLTLNSAGTLSGGGSLTVATFTWNSGTLGGGGGSLTVTTTVSIGTASTHDLVAFTLSNAGMLTWTGTGQIRGSGSAVITNQSGGILEVQTDASLEQCCSGGPALTLNNNSGAMFRKTVATGTSAINAVLNNNGSVQGLSGTLSFIQGGTSGGSFTATLPGVINFGGGTHSLTGTSTVSGNGTIGFSGGTTDIASSSYSVTGTTLINGGTANFNSPGTTNGFSLGPATSVGTLGGTSTLTVSGTGDWTSGQMVGSGSTSFSGGSTLSINGTGTKDVVARTLNNTGTLTWTGTGPIRGSLGAAITNQSGGIFDIQTDATLEQCCSGGAALTLNNTSGGIFRKTVASGTSTITALFNNSGTIDVNIGEINIALTFTQTPTSQLKFGIGGTAPLTGFGKLTIAGNAPFSNGTLTANLVRGFTPTAGQTFQVMTFGSSSGSFSTKNLSYPGGVFKDTYTATTLTLTAAAVVCGDANGDGQVNVSDVFYMINNLFTGGPPPVNSFDVNGDGTTTVADIFYLINFLFVGGAAPACP